jgi:hypothetical protein
MLILKRFPLRNSFLDGCCHNHLNHLEINLPNILEIILFGP